MSGIEIKMLPLPSLFLMEAEVPQKHVDNLNIYLDNLLEDEERKSAAGTLVGQIQQGEQLMMDHFDPKLEEFRLYTQHMAVQYVSNFFGMTGQQLDGDRQIEIDELWSVHSYEGDYNPLHDHGSETPIGLSCIMYLKVPEQIAALPNPYEDFKGLNGATGAVDGFTYFTWGNHGMRDVNMLRPATEEYVKPEVGTLIMFPSWLRHSVNPFFGEGERRTFSANINIMKQKD